MSQYSSLFNSTRIPEIGKDRLARFDNAKHVLVMRGGHFYVFNVFDKDGLIFITTTSNCPSSTFLSFNVGNMLEPLDIYACLKFIQQDPITPSQHPIGYLTAENRDTWAGVRSLLMEHNSGQIEAIDSALFNLVLDDVGTDNDPVKISKLFLHGNGANRYIMSLPSHGVSFDKTWNSIPGGSTNRFHWSLLGTAKLPSILSIRGETEWPSWDLSTSRWKIRLKNLEFILTKSLEWLHDVASIRRSTSDVSVMGKRK